MNYLIDGHNLIGKLPDIDLADPYDEIKLIWLLKSWAGGSRKRQVTLYFDGGLPGGEAKRLSSGSMRVVFASLGKTADALIVRAVEQARHAPEWTVVSSDREIIAVAQRRKMLVWTSEMFVEKLGQRPLPEVPLPEPPPGERDDPQIDEAEVNEWLAIFGPVPERPLPRPRVRPVAPARPQAPAAPRLTPAEAKHADQALNEDEINEWLDLFGFAAELDEVAASSAAPPDTAEPSQQRPSASQTVDNGLSDEDQAAWLAAFGDS